MCLRTVDEKTKEFEYGWKVFYVENGRLFGQFETKHGFMTKGYPKNKWIKDAKSGNIHINIYKKYKRGFHFYKYKKDATREGRKYSPFIMKVYKIKVRILA